MIFTYVSHLYTSKASWRCNLGCSTSVRLQNSLGGVIKIKIAFVRSGRDYGMMFGRQNFPFCSVVLHSLAGLSQVDLIFLFTEGEMSCMYLEHSKNRIKEFPGHANRSKLGTRKTARMKYNFMSC